MIHFIIFIVLINFRFLETFFIKIIIKFCILKNILYTHTHTYIIIRIYIHYTKDKILSNRLNTTYIHIYEEKKLNANNYIKYQINTHTHS